MKYFFFNARFMIASAILITLPFTAHSTETTLPQWTGFWSYEFPADSPYGKFIVEIKTDGTSETHQLASNPILSLIDYSLETFSVKKPLIFNEKEGTTRIDLGIGGDFSLDFKPESPDTLIIEGEAFTRMHETAAQEEISHFLENYKKSFEQKKTAMKGVHFVEWKFSGRTSSHTQSWIPEAPPYFNFSGVEWISENTLHAKYSQVYDQLSQDVRRRVQGLTSTSAILTVEPENGKVSKIILKSYYSPNEDCVMTVIRKDGNQVQMKIERVHTIFTRQTQEIDPDNGDFVYTLKE